MTALTTRLLIDHCPRCQRKLDAATNMEFHTPEPGDLSVCINCAAVLQWTQDMRLELADLKALILPAGTLLKLVEVIAAVEYVKPRVRHWQN